MRAIRRTLPRKNVLLNAGPISQDPAVSSGVGAQLELNRIPLADLQFAPVEAIRVWTDAAGKTHRMKCHLRWRCISRDYLPVRRTRDPKSCAHAGR